MRRRFSWEGAPRAAFLCFLRETGAAAKKAFGGEFALTAAKAHVHIVWIVEERTSAEKSGLSRVGPSAKVAKGNSC